MTKSKEVIQRIKNQFSENPDKMFKRYCLQELYPDSHFAEEIRRLRTNILFELTDKSAKIVCVTSPAEEEGKTTISINLAISFAHYKKKVLLIDANLGSPMLAKVFSLDGKGLTDALFHQLPPAEVIRKTKVHNLDVMIAGSNLLTSKELFTSKQFKAFIESLKKTDYDAIIIDSPSMKSADAPILARISDGSVLVLDAGATGKSALQNAKKQLLSIDAKILGIILNQKE